MGFVQNLMVTDPLEAGAHTKMIIFFAECVIVATNSSLNFVHAVIGG